jgi:tRNA 5-methylaminomethyl-2-thiouridine biosynthesis bifunctional protein
MTQITAQATLEWRNGLPYSTAFDDVYFSSDDGLLETEYVFIQGNALVNRWQSLADNNFTIMETGFGTGLNFLCACKVWLEFAPANAVLDFTSVEKYPLSHADMHKALQHWPALKPISDKLLAQYTTLLNTGTATLFNDRIRLQVLFGDATDCLSKLDTKTDAWFLDGFAPSKNPQMWQQALFEKMARLSHSKTTFATFTSAGVVRRGLVAAGFKVNKQPGFGKKREMINGYFIGNNHGN